MNLDNLVPEQEIASRLTRLQAALQAADLDGALLSYQTDVFYFSGTAQNAVLFVPAAGQARLYVRRSLERAQAETRLPAEPLPSLRALAAELAAYGLGPGSALGLVLDTLPAAQYVRLGELLQPGRTVDISRTVRRLRSRKSDWELAQFAATVPLARLMYDTVCAALQEGMTELELAAAVEAAARRHGHLGLVQTRGFNQRLYWGCAVAGANAAVAGAFEGVTSGSGTVPALPQGSSFHRIRRGEPVLVDLIALQNGYTVDHSRVFSLGPLPADLARAQRVAEDIYAHIIASLRPGVTGADIFAQAQQLAEAAGLAPYFMGAGRDQLRFVGHGVGLELDEWPVLAPGFDEPLEAGTVLAIEPKFLFPGRGVVGTENTVAVLSDGVRVFGYEPLGLTTL